MRKEEKMLIAEAVREKERRLKEERLKYFIPNGKQEEFIKLVGLGKVFVCVLSAANSVGKTAVAANVLANVCWGSQNQWFKGLPLFENWPYPKQGRVVSTPKNVEDTGAIQIELKKWFPLRRYTVSKGKKHYDSLYQTDTDFVFDLMTYDQEVSEFEGATLGFVWFDEPPPYSVYKATIARMRMGGIIFITMTPLTQAAWLYDDIILRQDGVQRKVVYAEDEDNCKEHGVRGILEHSDIVRMRQEYDPDELLARTKGQFVYLSGLIYKTFNRGVHLVEPFPIPKEWTRYNVVDPHDRRPFALGWLAVNPTGDVFFYDEWPREEFHKIKTCDKIIKDYADIIRIKEGEDKIYGRIIDPNFGNKKSSSSGLTIKQEFAREKIGFHAIDVSDDIVAGHLKVREYLKYDNLRGIKPKLFFFNTLKNFIYGMEHYTWDDYKGKIADDKDLKQKPKDKFKDFPDLVRYGLMSSPGYVQYVDDTWPKTPGQQFWEMVKADYKREEMRMREKEEDEDVWREI